MRKQNLRLFIMGSISVLGFGLGCHEGRTERNTEDTCRAHSDCREPYICDNGFCRPQCEEDDDCPDGICTRSSIDGDVKVCVKSEEENGDSCTDDSCPDPLICAADGVCRNECLSDDDCDQDMYCFQYACFEGEFIKDADGGLTLRSNEGVCAGVNCSNHGRCADNNGVAECQCDPGYKPEELSCIVDFCYQIECSNHGICVDDGVSADCVCDPGYELEGLDCLLDVCYQKHCTANSSCVDKNGTATCECNPGFQLLGELCIFDPCYKSVCPDNSTCSDFNGVPGCICDAGYKPNGQVCIVDLCYQQDCSDHGSCVDSFGTANCRCDPGYKAVDLKCENDPCYQEYCSYNGVCMDNDGVAECACYEDYHPEGLSCIHDNRDPLAYSDSGTTWLNVPVTIQVLNNDIDQDGDQLTIVDVDQPTHGSTEIVLDDSAIGYIPETGFIGQDSFSYLVSDQKGGEDGDALVYVTVNEDTAVPGKVGNLTALYSGEQNTIDLSWTATGNDGTYGLAKAYELKISNTPITGENFDSLESYPQDWEPLGYPQNETHQIDLDWYSGTWYLAIKVLDGVPQYGPISEILEVNTDADFDEDYDFGVVAIGATSTGYIDFSQDPDGLVDLVISDMQLTGSSEFSFVNEESTEVDVRLKPGDYHTIAVSFQPSDAGDSGAQLIVYYDVGESTSSYLISLTGIGI